MSAADLSLVTPDYSLGEGAWFALVLVLTVLFPGHALRRQLGLRSGDLWHRAALACVLGVLWTSLLYFALAACHVQGCHVFLSPLPWVVWLVRVRRRPRMRPFRLLWGRPARPVLLGLLLAVMFAGGYFMRTASLIRTDETGLRLYGAFYSDKLTNMSPCAALRDGVPPAALRISGYRFPSHYFPHLFVAAFDVGAGIDYLDGFWFYVATFGVFVRSLAVLAFSRRMLRSPWLACLAIALFGLWRFSPQDKTLDLSFALLLLAIDALDRYRVSRRSRWAVLAVGLIAAMPFYEVFTGAAALGGLVVWAAGSLFASRKETVLRTAVAVAAIVGAMLAVRLLYFGSQLASPPELAFKNVYLQSYKHEWRDRLREPDPPTWMARVYAWKRGKAISEVADLPGDDRPGKLEEIFGEIIYFLGFAGYFVLRFVNLALFGAVALAARRRGGGWNMAIALVASIAVVGFALPCVLVWGHTAEGQWWETPNIYRLTTCAWMLLVLVGAGALVEAMGEFRRARWWVPLAIALWQVWIMTVAYFERPTSYHHVPKGRLETIAFLRTHVPAGEVVLHPWVHDLIREESRPNEVSWVYKRHFTLGSNLAGCQMYYEGREDHLFINGFVAAEEVYRRRRLRDRFYEEPDRETLREITENGQVRWIVADSESPVPKSVADCWRLQFQSGNVSVYSRQTLSSAPEAENPVR